MITYLSQGIIIKKTSKRGLGLFAKKEFHTGELVVHGRKIKKSKERTNHSFQINWNSHVQLDKIARSINHSCNPNTGIRNNNCGGYDFIALRNVKKSEEITWDY